MSACYALIKDIVFFDMRVRLSILLFVRLSVRPSVSLQVKVFGQGSFWLSQTICKLTTHVTYDMIFLILMPD